MKRIAFLLTLFAAGLRPGFAPAAEPGAAVSFADTAFAEKWAFAADRAALLDELPPLSDAKFYYATLLLQQQGKTADARASLDAWRDEWLRRNGVNNAEPALEEYRRLKRRQAALEFFGGENGTTGTDLAKALDVAIPDAMRRPDSAHLEWPTAFPAVDPAERALKAWSKENARTFLRRDLDSKFAAAALAAGLKVAAQDVASVLSRPELADAPGILDLVEADLLDRTTASGLIDARKRFGARAVHKALPLAALLELRKRLAGTDCSVDDNADFAAAVIAALGPDAESGRPADEEKRLHLARVVEFARTLPPRRSAILAAARYRALEAAPGLPPAEQIAEYLATPRRWAAHRGEALKEEWSRLPDAVFDPVPDACRRAAPGLLDPPGSEDGLVRELLLAHFVAGSASPAAFKGLLDAPWLDRLAAEADLLAGRETDPARVREVFDDAAFAALRDRRTLAWPRGTAALRFAPDAPVSLRLDVKNVPQVRVAVYDLDAFAVVRALGGDPTAELGLEGSVPTASRTLDFSALPAMRLHAETLDFPEMARPGLYVAEVSGSGLAARVLVRKGGLRVVHRTAASGVVLAALGEDGAPRADAELWLGERKFAADPETGEIAVPFVAPGDATAKAAVVRAGRVAQAVAPFLLEERYEFSASGALPAESLVPGEEAALVLRPRLTVSAAREPVSLALVGNPELALRLANVDGTARDETFPLPALRDGEDVVHRFRVPAGLQKVEATLRGTVRNVAAGKADAVSATFAAAFATIEKTDRIETVLFSRDAAGARLEVRGRAGEPIAGEPVCVGLRCADGSDDVRNLQTDANGAIDLGALAAVETVSATCRGQSYKWAVPEAERGTQPRVVAVAAGERAVLFFPGFAPEGLPARDVPAAWFSVRKKRADGRPGESAVAALSFLDGGRVAFDPPGPGVWNVEARRTGQAAEVHVVDAQPAAVRAGLLACDALAWPDAASHLAPRVAFAKRRDDGSLAVGIENATGLTRVHAVARRFAPRHGAKDDPYNTLLGRELPEPERFDFGPSAATEPTDAIRIGDEARYVLDRAGLPRPLGVMLERPSALVSPWSPSEARTGDVGAAPGRAFDVMASRAPAMRGKALGRYGAEGAASGAPLPSFAFLPGPAVVLANAKPDAKGRLRIPAEALEGFAEVQIVVEDAASTRTTLVPLPRAPWTPREVRHFDAGGAGVAVRERKSEGLGAGARVPADADATVKFTSLATVADLVRLFQSVENDATLADFAFVAEWADLPPERRLELYGSHACHELDLFLHEKDPDFFAAVVAPRLREKRRLDFVDAWLLGRDLSPWSAPGARDALSIPEKVLLARRDPAAAGAFAALARDWRAGFAADDAETGDTAFDAAMAAAPAPKEVTTVSMVKSPIVMRNEPNALRRSAPAAAAERRLELAAEIEEEAEEEDFEDESGDWDEVASGDWDVEVAEPPGALALGAIRANRAGAAARLAADAAGRAAQPAFRRPSPATREWLESNWWRRDAEDGAPDVEPNAFWADALEAAAAGGAAPLLSPDVARAAGSFSERMLALALEGLPLRGEGVRVERGEDGSAAFVAASPAILLRETTLHVRDAAAADPVLVLQRRFDPANPTREVDGETWERNLGEGDAFWTGRPYAMRTVLSNPTGRRRLVTLSVSVPDGAVPLCGDRAAAARTVVLQPWGSEQSVVRFYFPHPAADGAFAVRPASALERGVLAGAAAPAPFRAADGAPPPDTASWDWIARNGTDEEALAFLRGGKLEGANLAEAGWRAVKSADFARRAVAALDARGRGGDAEPFLVQGGFRHGDRDLVARYLGDPGDDCVGRFGPAFRAGPLAVDAEDAAAFEHREFWPLVHARVHPLGDGRSDNPRLARQWRELLELIGHEPAPTPDRRLLAAIALYAMERRDEAAAQFDAAVAAGLPENVATDYLRAWRAFADGRPADAAAIAEKRADLPLEPWRGRFREILAQASQIESGDPGTFADGAPGDAPELPRAAFGAAETAPGLFEVETAGAVRVRLFPIDAEMLFSMHPFEDPGRSSRAAFVRPAWEKDFAAPADGAPLRVELPAEWNAKALSVEIAAADGSASETLLHTPGTLRVQAVRPRGELLVRDGAGRPLPRAYVKVFARPAGGGAAVFHKDGYTDLRGVFDYASVSARPDVDGLEFAILVVHDQAGSRTLRVLAP